MKVSVPDYVLQHYQDPEREVALSRYFYLHGDVADSSDWKNLIKTLTPLNVGDFVHIPINEEGEVEKRQIKAIEYHEMDLKGLGTLEFIAFLIFAK